MVVKVLKRVLRWVPSLAWAGLIFYLSSNPMPEDINRLEIPYLDKAGHAVFFGILALLLLYALSQHFRDRAGKAVGLAFILASLYGITDEVHQYFNPVRDADIFDWIADTVGASIVFAAAKVFPGLLRLG